MSIVRCLVIVALALSVAACGRQDPTQLTDATDSPYQPGQRWSYKTRPGEEQSTLVILKVDQNPVIGQIVHVRVEGIALKDPRKADGLTQVMEFMPFNKAAIDASVTQKVADGVTLDPQSLSNYQEWRGLFQRGEVEAFPLPVAEVIAMYEHAFQIAPPASAATQPAEAAPSTQPANAAPAPTQPSATTTPSSAAPRQPLGD